MSLFGGSAPPSRSSYESDASVSSSSRSSPSVVSVPEPHNTQEAQKLNVPISLNVDDDLDTDTESEEEESEEEDEDEPVRPNRFHGQPQTWQGYTEAERQIAEALEQMENSDLSAHLYNAHALKQQLRRPTEEMARLKNWQSRDTWLKSGEDLKYTDAAGLVQAALAMPKEWTAWPVPPTELSSSDESSDSELVGNHPDEWAIESGSKQDAGEELREELLALFLRMAKERWNLRDASSSESDAEDDSQTSRSRSRSKSAESSQSRSMSRTNVRMNDQSDADRETTGYESDAEQDRTSGKKRGRKPQLGTFSKPDILADDMKAKQLLQPSIQSIMSRLDELAWAIHRTRANHVGRGGSAGSSMSEFTSGAESSGPPSRSSSRAQSRKSTSRRPTSRPSSRTSLVQTSRAIRKGTGDNGEVDAAKSDASSGGASDWEASHKEQSLRKRRRSSSSGSDSDASTVQDKELREGLLDLSDVLGLAAVKCWHIGAIARTAQRCAALFGESMSFIPLDESLASKAVPESVHYTPSTIPTPSI